MSTGKLKPQYNRVRTSNALKTTDIWSNTIGIDSEGGTNAVIEASIYAPGGGGRGRAAKQQRAQELIASSGFEPSVRDFEGLKALARRSGGDAAALNRGACKICGGLGHLTKQCRNFLDNGSGAAAAAAAAAAGGAGDRELLTAEDEALLLGSSSDSMDSSDLGSDSDGGRGRKKRREKSSSGRDRERSSKKSKKEKSSKKHKKEKSSRKHKRERRSRSRSRSRDRARQQRSRSRSRDRGA